MSILYCSFTCAQSGDYNLSYPANTIAFFESKNHRYQEVSLKLESDSTYQYVCRLKRKKVDAEHGDFRIIQNFIILSYHEYQTVNFLNEVVIPIFERDTFYYSRDSVIIYTNAQKERKNFDIAKFILYRQE